MPPKHLPDSTLTVPLRHVGPLLVLDADRAPLYQGLVPLATYESPLWPSVERGARLTARAGGVVASVRSDAMTRSVLLHAPTSADAHRLAAWLETRRPDLETVAASTSRFARLLSVHTETVGPHLYVRFAFSTGDASGHNMATRAAEALLNWILAQRPETAYGSISGNLCCDKKTSAVNGLLGRGKSVTAEALLPAPLVTRFLHTTPEAIERLCWHKNWVGSTLAGSLRSANAHAANMLLAFYLATGQDAANIVEGSQCFTLAETLPDGALRFTCDLPNLILGTAGNGKNLPDVAQNLAALGCADPSLPPGANARRLASICAAVVLCGELSLLAAQTNPGELMSAHLSMERRPS
jgi:hydroxymethylglutaryl-CoA reductase (NADPH)